MSAGAAVADSWAVLAAIRGEGESARMMRRLLHRARAGNLRLLLNLVNLGEVYYRLIQIAGRSAADEHLARLRATPFEIVPVREPLVLEAGRVKATHPVSYADAFAVATARLEHAPVVTGDPEIIALPRSVVRVRRLVR
jgi:predicted nucleic acid-binding protein